MNIKLPYKILLIILLFSTGAFAYSPFIAKHSLSDAIKEKNNEKWLALVNIEPIKNYNYKLIESLYRLKFKIEMDDSAIEKTTAMHDFTFAMQGLKRLSDKMAKVNGFTHLLCGKVTSYPKLPAEHDKDCWILDGQVHWQSLTRVKISYQIPESAESSHLYLQRTGLLSWQVVDIELPVDDMFNKFIAQIKAKQV